MTYTSMTDAQRQAKYGYDDAPWVDRNGERYVDPKFAMAVTLDFAQRSECIPSPDPLPWWSFSNHRSDGVFRDSEYALGREFKPRPWGTFTPDREFVRSEVNPILSAFRDDKRWDSLRLWLNGLRMAQGFTSQPLTRIYTARPATPKQIDHASRVLERLAAVTA